MVCVKPKSPVGRDAGTSLVAGAAARLPGGARQWLYRLGPLTRWLRRTINRTVPSGVHPCQVAAGELRGEWLLLDLQVDKDLWLGTYEPEVAQAIRRFTPPSGTAYDLGANVGYMSLLFAKTLGPAGRVFSFEPLPGNVARLRQAIALNDLESRITLVPAAVGAATGTARFRVHASGSMGRLDSGAGRDDGFVGDIPVDVVRLDDFVLAPDHPAPDVVKIDLEGGEGLALAGMERLLRQARPRLLIEVHGPQAAAEVSRRLAAAGYRLHRMQAGYPSLAPGDPARLPKHIVALGEEDAA
jgi:FkbM family methyltransferase